jgi:hypothetical protein
VILSADPVLEHAAIAPHEAAGIVGIELEQKRMSRNSKATPAAPACWMAFMRAAMGFRRKRR